MVFTTSSLANEFGFIDNKAREDAELAARKELLERERGIREEAAKRVAEDFNTRICEQEETINSLREQLTAAKQTAEQGSQQLQGEILELDVERDLRSAFPLESGYLVTKRRTTCEPINPAPPVIKIVLVIFFCRL